VRDLYIVISGLGGAKARSKVTDIRCLAFKFFLSAHRVYVCCHEISPHQQHQHLQQQLCRIALQRSVATSWRHLLVTETLWKLTEDCGATLQVPAAVVPWRDMHLNTPAVSNWEPQQGAGGAGQIIFNQGRQHRAAKMAAAAGSSKQATSAADLPTDATAIRNILKTMGVEAHEPRVVNMLLDFMYSYVSGVLSDASAFAEQVRHSHTDWGVGSA